MTFQKLRQKTQPSWPVIDIHVHPAGDMPHFGVNSASDDVQFLIEVGRRSGIEKFCVSSLGPGYPHSPDMVVCQKANDYVLLMRDLAPHTILPFCYVILENEDDAVREVERCIGKHKMVGIKLWISHRASDIVLDPIMELAETFEVPVLQHAWLKTTGNLPGESTPADVAHLARRHPKVQIIMAHLNGANPRGLEVIQDTPNVFIDTSGGDPESGMVELAVERLGVKRVIYGSDAPGRHFGVSLAKVLGAEISPSDQRDICWNNASRLLPSWAGISCIEGIQ